MDAERAGAEAMGRGQRSVWFTRDSQNVISLLIFRLLQGNGIIP